MIMPLAFPIIRRTIIHFLMLMVMIIVVRAEWQLIWSDEFYGDHLDTNKWEYETGGQGWGNYELEYYTANRSQNVRVNNGHLVIEARAENYQNNQFTSGRLHSKQDWTYGRFEARARLPRGHQLWPAIWMYPTDNCYGGWAKSGEIDIMEYRGDICNQISGTIHYGGSRPNNTSSGSGNVVFPKVDFSSSYHRFGLEWNQKSIRWLLNGQEFHEENIDRCMWSGLGPNPYNANGQPFDKPFRFRLNVAVGGRFFQPPFVTPEEARYWPKPTMEVDYVRVFQWKTET